MNVLNVLNDRDKVRQPRRPLKRQARKGDWCDVVKFAVVAVVMTTSVFATGSAESAVIVGSALGALLR